MPDKPLQNSDPREDAAPNAPARVAPFTREELDRWYTHELLSLQQIADRAAQFGTPVSRAKVREWLLALGIPRRDFSHAARIRALKRRAAQAGAGPDGSLIPPE